MVVVRKNKKPAVDYTSKLQPGSRGDIVVNAGIYKGRYPSRVQEIQGDLVLFDHPLLKEALLPVYRDMNFTFVMEDGGALYLFDMAVRRSDRKIELPAMWALLLDYPTRVQRRQFLRISCLWEVVIFHIEAEERRPMSSRWMEAVVIDVSLGGYRFRLPFDVAGGAVFESKDRILLRFKLGNAFYFLSGRASRVARTDKAWEVGVGFDSVPVSVEKKLFEFVRQQEIMGRDQR